MWQGKVGQAMQTKTPHHALLIDVISQFQFAFIKSQVFRVARSDVRMLFITQRNVKNEFGASYGFTICAVIQKEHNLGTDSKKKVISPFLSLLPM